MTNKELHAELDAIMSDYLRLLSKESQVAARATQGHCVGLLNEVAKRLPDEPSHEVSNSG
jgi:hypothetical protein